MAIRKRDYFNWIDDATGDTLVKSEGESEDEEGEGEDEGEGEVEGDRMGKRRQATVLLTLNSSRDNNWIEILYDDKYYRFEPNKEMDIGGCVILDSKVNYRYAHIFKENLVVLKLKYDDWDYDYYHFYDYLDYYGYDWGYSPLYDYFNDEEDIEIDDRRIHEVIKKKRNDPLGGKEENLLLSGNVVKKNEKKEKKSFKRGRDTARSSKYNVKTKK